MGLLLAAALRLLSPVPDEAPPPAEFTLDWQAPATCPSQETIEALVAEMVAGAAGGEGAMEVIGVVEENTDGYALVLTTVLGDRVATRDLRAKDCDELARSLALVVAVTMVPTLAPPEPQPDPKPQPEPEPQPRLEPTPPPAPAPEPEAIVLNHQEAPPRRRPRLAPHVWTRAGLGVDAGGGPVATLGARLGLGVSWEHVRMSVEGTYVAPQRAHSEQGSVALVQQGVVGVVACGVARARPWSFPLCGGVEVGALRADSRNVTPRATATGRLATPLLRAGVLWRWRRVGVWLDAELLVRGSTTRVVVADEEIFRPNPAWFRALAGIEVALGGKEGSPGQGF